MVRSERQWLPPTEVGQPWARASGSPVPADEVVDELARDAELWRDRGELVGREPAGIDDLRLVRLQLARGPACGEPDHQRAGEGPGLASEVPEVLDFDAGLLADLAGDGLLERLSHLDETRQHRME